MRKKYLLLLIGIFFIPFSAFATDISQPTLNSLISYVNNNSLTTTTGNCTFVVFNPSGNAPFVPPLGSGGSLGNNDGNTCAFNSTDVSYVSNLSGLPPNTAVTVMFGSYNGSISPEPSSALGDTVYEQDMTNSSGQLTNYIVPDVSTTSIVTIDSPVNNFDYNGNPITFSGHFLNAGNESNIGFDLENTSISESIQLSPLIVNYSCGITGGCPYSQTITLPRAGSYTIQALLEYSDGTISASSTVFDFSLATTSGNPVYLTNVDMIGTSTASGVFLQFLNVPLLLETKLPFSYFYQFGQQFSYIFSTSTQSIATTSIPVGFDTNLTISPDSVRMFVDPNSAGYEALYLLMQAILYFSAFYFIFKDWRNHI